MQLLCYRLRRHTRPVCFSQRPPVCKPVCVQPHRPCTKWQPGLWALIIAYLTFSSVVSGWLDRHSDDYDNPHHVPRILKATYLSWLGLFSGGPQVRAGQGDRVGARRGCVGAVVGRCHVAGRCEACNVCPLTTCNMCLLTTWRAAEHSRIAAGVSQPTGLWVFHHHCSCDLHCEFGPAGMGHCLCVRLGVETRGWALACLHEPVVCRCVE